MRIVTVLGLAVLMNATVAAAAEEEVPPATAVAQVLDSFHHAASVADGQLYFSLFAEGAVYLGTDASERWTVDEFKAFAEPYFSAGKGWTYSVTERHVQLAADGGTAWFDEALWNQSYGACRGTGVLTLGDKGWRIAHYSLTFTIPNDLAGEITVRIKDFETGRPAETR